MIGPCVRVVLVDDCEDMRQILRIVMTRNGFEVVGEAADGVSGELATRLTSPDVVLLDLDMPVMDGYRALPRLREAAPDAKVVVFSHDVTFQSTKRLRELGAHGWLRKGASLHELVAVVRSTLFELTAPVAVLQEVE